MKVTYYPGCSLEGTAADYAASIAAMASFLDVGLVEFLDWNCCGASSAHSFNHHLALSLAARNLALAKEVAGKKFMWDGATYVTRDDARQVMETYKKDGVKVHMLLLEDKYLVYTRRLVTQVAAG